MIRTEGETHVNADKQGILVDAVSVRVAIGQFGTVCVVGVGSLLKRYCTYDGPGLASIRI